MFKPLAHFVPNGLITVLVSQKMNEVLKIKRTTLFILKNFYICQTYRHDQPH